MDFEPHITFSLNVSFQISHLEMVINPVDDEIREPGISSASLEEFVEKLERFLAEVVSKNLETHERIILAEGLSEEGEAEVIDLVVSHV